MGQDLSGAEVDDEGRAEAADDAEHGAELRLDQGRVDAGVEGIFALAAETLHLVLLAAEDFDGPDAGDRLLDDAGNGSFFGSYHPHPLDERLPVTRDRKE